MSFCSYVCICIHMYPIKKKNIGYFYKTMSINTTVICQNICEFVFKHYKSSIEFHQYTSYVIETNKKGDHVGSSHRGHGPILKTVATFFLFLIHNLCDFNSCIPIMQKVRKGCPQPCVSPAVAVVSKR